MKEYRQDPGGRRIKGDDLKTIQEIALLTEKHLSNYGNFVISGCEVNGSAIGSGIIMLDGKACSFGGAPQATFPYYVIKSVETENVAYESGAGTGIGYELYEAVEATASDSGAFRLDTAKRFNEVFKPTNADNAANANTLNGKPATAFLERDGGTMTQGKSINVIPVTSGQNAVGVLCRNTANQIVGGTGGLFADGGLRNMFLGWSDYPWEVNNCLSASPSALTYKGYKIWHSGNVGSGSSLDADLLDGKHANDFILEAGNGLLPAGDCYNVAYWHALKKGWWMYAPSVVLNNKPEDGIYALVYVGGWGQECHITWYRQTGVVSWEMSCNNTNKVEWSKNARITDNVASATQLQTVRTIWGQSFNGTANVSGDMTNVGNITTTGGIVLPYRANTWLSMATRTDQILGSEKNTSTSAHSLFTVKNSNGSAVAFGGLGVDNGFYGFTADTIAKGNNYYNWYTTWNTDSGLLTHSTALEVKGNITATGRVRTSGVFSAGEENNDGYGYFNVSRTSNIENATCYAWNSYGQGAFGLGFNTRNHIVMGGASTSKTITPWLTVAQSEATFTGKLYSPGFYQSSDERLKDIKGCFEPSVEDITELPLFYYSLKANPHEKELGTSAQEVRKKFPELVREDNNGMLSVSYSKLSILALKGLSLQNEKINQLEVQNKLLKERLEKIEQQLINQITNKNTE